MPARKEGENTKAESKRNEKQLPLSGIG